MATESIVSGLIVLLLCGSLSFYLYVRHSFLEKKVAIMESILVDARVAIDSSMMDNTVHPAHIPIAHTPGVHVSPPVAMDASEAEEIPEEKFYSSVLEQAHENAASQDLSGADAPPPLQEEQPVVAALPPATELPPNLASMSRNDLAELAIKRGLRVKKSLKHAEILALLRRSVSTQNATSTTGTGNVSEPTGTVFQGGASLDGTVPMDLAQGGASLD